MEGRKDSTRPLLRDWGKLFCAKTWVVCLLCLFWKQLQRSCGIYSPSSSFSYCGYYVFPMLCFMYLFFRKLMGVLAFCLFIYFILILFLLLSIIILRFIYVVSHSSFFFCLPKKKKNGLRETFLFIHPFACR